jgi:hypothetical protein
MHFIASSILFGSAAYAGWSLKPTIAILAITILTISDGLRCRSDIGAPNRWQHHGVRDRQQNKALKRLVAHAVAVEPVSIPEFPANREINREFCRIRLLSAI